MVSLRERKKEIRVSALLWPDKKVLLSQAAAQSVLEVRALKLSVQQRRQEAFPKNLRSWVADRAMQGTRAPPRNFADGDMRTSGINGGSMQGWNQTRCILLHLPRMAPAPIGPASRNNGLQTNRNNRFLRTRSPRPASGQSTARPATCLTHSTGKFPSSTADASSPFLTRIKTPSSSDWRWRSRNSEPRIACDGTVEWKRMVTKIAAQHGISVQFTDQEMQHALHLLQRLANPRQRQQERGGR